MTLTSEQADAWAALRSPGGRNYWTATEPTQHGDRWCVTLVILLGVAEDEHGTYWNYGEPVYAWGDTPDASRAEAVRLTAREGSSA